MITSKSTPITGPDIPVCKPFNLSNSPCKGAVLSFKLQGIFLKIARYLLVLCLFFTAVPLLASDDLLEAGRTATIGFLLENAIKNKLIAGGVVAIGNHAGIIYMTAGGRINAAEGAPFINERTIFDVASLTKVIATTPAVMKLLEAGAINLMDPVTRWFPEFAGSGREDITILNLLTHTSGLEDFALSTDNAISDAIRKVIVQENWILPGGRFRYADINFIILGELVRRASGKTLDVFCREQLYQPLNLHDTMFTPPRELGGLIAPTMEANQEMASGTVQDYNARRLGGVAGHAGLFSTTSDLSRFARMLLGGGVVDGRRIFSERVVSQMTAPYFYSNGNVVRGLGWDIESPYSAPKGVYFSDMSFGHTGYSGASIWIDPHRDLFVVMLTTRLEYRDTRSFKRLRSDISTLAVALFHKTDVKSGQPEAE
jgi:CubicO group peptidase (beta-lactamase class C family)